MQIYVRTPAGNTITLTVNSSETIGQVQSMIQKQGGISPDEQKFMVEKCGTKNMATDDPTIIPPGNQRVIIAERSAARAKTTKTRRLRTRAILAMATKTEENMAHLISAIDGYLQMNPNDNSMVDIRIMLESDRKTLQNELLMLKKKRSDVDTITSSRASSPSKQGFSELDRKQRREWEEAFSGYTEQLDTVRAFLQSLKSSAHLKRLKDVLEHSLNAACAKYVADGARLGDAEISDQQIDDETKSGRILDQKYM